MSSDQLDAVFSAVSHAARRQILVSLHARGGTMTAGEIADRFKHSWPTTTRHLGVLESAQLLEVHKEGRHRLYALSPSPMVGAGEWLFELAVTDTDQQTDDRPEWTKLSYSKMRNARPPGD